VTQKARSHQRERCDHGNLIDLQHHLVADFPVKALAFLHRHLVHGLFLRGQIVLQNDRRADVDINAAVPFAQDFRGFDDFNGVFLDFRRSGQLLQIGLFLDHAVVADVHGHRSQILAILVLIGLDNHGQKPIFGHHHFSGPASAAFDEELERESFLEQCGHVFGKDLSINFVAAKTPPQKKRSGTAENIPHRKKRKIVPRCNKRHLNVMFVKYVRQQQIINVTAMAGDDDKRHFLG